MLRKLATESEIQAEMQRRIRLSPELDETSRELLKAPMPVRLAVPGHGGCNWTVTGHHGSEQLQQFVAVLVRAAQAEFNLHS